MGDIGDSHFVELFYNLEKIAMAKRGSDEHRQKMQDIATKNSELAKSAGYGISTSAYLHDLRNGDIGLQKILLAAMLRQRELLDIEIAAQQARVNALEPLV